jgi:hypothetical protein
MRFTAALILTFFVMASSALAMDTSQIAWYAHGDLALPSGSFGDVAGTGFGGGVGGAMPYSEALTFRGEVGYIHFGGKELLGADYSYALIPFFFLGEYQFSPGSQVYGLGGVGMTMARFSWDWTNPWTGAKENVSDSSSEFGIAVGGGFHLNEQMTLEGRYNIVSDLDFLSVHFLYNF